MFSQTHQKNVNQRGEKGAVMEEKGGGANYPLLAFSSLQRTTVYTVNTSIAMRWVQPERLTSSL